MIKNQPFSLVFQILQECIFQCAVCNRRFERGEKRLTPFEREKMVDVLALRGLKRLTVTGGEPMMIYDELTQFLEYCHQKKVYTCLSTTGYNINEDKLRAFDAFLDQLLISVPTLKKEEWMFYFGSKKYSSELYNTVINLLNQVKDYEIIVEISTVVQKNNLNKVIKLGEELAKVNTGILWRLEYYYPMGINYDLKDLFEIGLTEINEIHEEVKKHFDNTFKGLYLSKPTRENSPDIFITPTGKMVKTSDNKYSISLGDVFVEGKTYDYKMRRNWSEYEQYCRNWNWK